MHDAKVKRAVGYLRVSTPKQARANARRAKGEEGTHGLSLEKQEHSLRLWAELHGAEEILIYRDEGLSGKRDDRPGFVAAVEDVCQNGGVLVAYNLKRLARSVRQLALLAERLERCGADIAVLEQNIDTSTPTGRLFYNLMAALAQFDSDIARYEAMQIVEYKRSRGEWLGGKPPYGYRLDSARRCLLVVPEEQERIEAFVDFREEGWSYGMICKYAAQNGWCPPDGDIWHRRTVQRIIDAAVRRAGGDAEVVQEAA